MNRTALMTVARITHTVCEYSVTLSYRGRVLHTYTCHLSDIGAVLQLAHTNAINRGFTGTRAEYI